MDSLDETMTPVLSSREGRLTCGWYWTFFFAAGAHLPFWPVWLAHWGLTEAEIASYMGLALVLRIAGSTMLPALADRFAARRVILALGGLLTAAGFLAHLAIETRAALLLATLATTFTTSPLIPLGEALGVRASARYGFAYAHARAAGSLAFLSATVLVGLLVAQLGPEMVLWTMALHYFAAGTFGAAHPGGGAPPGVPDRSRLREGLDLMRNRAFLAFAIAASVGQASHAVYYVYASLTWAAQGIGAGVIGALWGLGVAAEIALMLGPGRVFVQRFGPARALAAMGAAGVLRWALMSFEPGLPALLPLQCLHALTFGVGHLGAMAFIATAIPPRLQASAQGVQGGGLGGAALAGATLAAGVITAAAGPAAAYWLAAAMSLVALIAALCLSVVWNGERLVTEPPDQT